MRVIAASHALMDAPTTGVLATWHSAAHGYDSVCKSSRIASRTRGRCAKPLG